ncbi:hypothetical protein [Actinomadura sp. 3N407]|uniref:hypothetical protein n=1 Tax=Actinomadura sp. 3N407 TaxID=3457423 RepID=UPI003FCE4D59
MSVMALGEAVASSSRVQVEAESATNSASTTIAFPVVRSRPTRVKVEQSASKTVEQSSSEVVTFPGEPRKRVLIFIEDLARPIYVFVQQSDGLTSLADTATGVFGVGVTLREAVVDLHAALREHLEFLSEQPALSPELEYHLRELRTYFDTP